MTDKSNLAKTITKDLLARRARICVIDPTGTWWGGAFNNTRGSLRSLGLIDYRAPGMVVARPVWFVSEDG